jgi:hypothetical protein
VCDLDFYGGCFDDSEDLENSYRGDDVLELSVNFDYELYYRNGAIATRTIQHVEGAMLEHLAAVVGLNKCGDPDRRQRRRVQSDPQYLHDFTDEQLEMFLGISIEPLDFIDPDFGKYKGDKGDCSRACLILILIFLLIYRRSVHCAGCCFSNREGNMSTGQRGH